MRLSDDALVRLLGRMARLQPQPEPGEQWHDATGRQWTVEEVVVPEDGETTVRCHTHIPLDRFFAGTGCHRSQRLWRNTIGGARGRSRTT